MPTRAGETGVCPHCKTGVRFEHGKVNSSPDPASKVVLRVPTGAWLDVRFAGCPVCGKPVLEVPHVGVPGGGQTAGPGLLYPKGAGRPLGAEVVAAAPYLVSDFEEAVAVLPTSRKASAALSRRCLQYILANVGKAKKRDLADQIDEVLGSLPPQLAENVDAVRQVGNFAAHPIKSTNTGEIVEVEDGEAEWLLDVIEELCEYYYVAPAKAAAKRAALNQKLADLGKPALKQP
jgi:uncharacterized protein (DUF2164 family)